MGNKLELGREVPDLEQDNKGRRFEAKRCAINID